MNARITIADLLEAKHQKQKIDAVSCYDYTTALLVSQTDVEMIIVGDSAAQLVLGHDSTLAAIDHVRNRRPGHVEGPVQVHLDDVVPLGGVHLSHRAVDVDARVVDEDVQLSVSVDHLLDDALAVRGALDRPLVNGRPGAFVVCEELFGGYAVSGVSGRHSHAFAHETLGDGEPDASYSTRDKRDLAFQL